MNVSMKKLLSVLVVMAMVVSMIVPVNFSFVSAETSATTSVIPEAAQAEIAKGQTVKEKSAELHQAGTFSGTGEVQAICPVCYANGDTSTKTWKPITADYALTDGTIAIKLGTNTADGEIGDHFYFAEDFVRNYDMGQDGMFTRSGCVNFNGKTITLNGAKLVELYANRTINFLDTAGGAMVTGSSDRYGGDGKALRVRETGAVANLYGGTFMGMNDTYDATNAKSDHADGSGTIAVRGGTLNIYEGTTIIGVDGTTGNTAKYGGAIYMGAAGGAPTVNMYGGVIKGGKATNGGNIYIGNSGGKNGVFNMYAGEILNGTATYGGNFVISSGSATSYGTLNVYGGFIAGGSAPAQKYGRNIYLSTYKNSSSATVSSAALNMCGGTLVGELATSSDVATANKPSPNFREQARLVPYGIDSNGNVYTATITLSNVTFASGNMRSGGELWGTGTVVYKWCDACGAVKNWTITTEPKEIAANGHNIFKEAGLEYTFATPDAYSALLKTKGNACIDLNGADIKIHKGRFLTVNAGGTVNVWDSRGDATVSGSFDYYTGNGRVIQTTDLSTSTSTLNLYGGTYKGFVYEGDAANTTYDAETGEVTKAGTKNATALIRVRNNATVNLFEGATVDGSSIEQKVAAVFVGNSANTSSTFNLEGGTVIGTKNAGGDGDAVRLGNSANSATMNVNSGEIIGAGGIAVNVRSGSVLNVTGGSITNEKGGAVNCYQENTISVSGGELSTLNMTSGSTLTLSGKPVIGMLYTNGVLANVDALTAEADITVSDEVGTVLTTVTTAELGSAIKHTNPDLSIKKNADGQYAVAADYADAVEGVFDPEHCGGWAYCPVCGEKVKWTAVTEPTAMTGGHYYLADTIDYDYCNDGNDDNDDSDNNFLSGHGTINLNGKNVTINAGRFLVAGAGVTNIIDTEGGSVVIGSGNKYDNNGTTIKVDGAEAELYVRGGTFKGADDTLAEGATDTDTTGSVVRVRTGTLHLYEGAVIDGEGYDKIGNYSLVYIGHTSGEQAFYMHGGEIKNGTSAQYGGNVFVRQGKTFEMSGGAILNGTAKQGGNVYIASDATTGGIFNMTGGFIGGGEATSGSGNYGDNVGLQTYKNTDGTYVNNTTFSMTDGTIAGGVAVCWGDKLANKTFTISGRARIVPEVLYEGVTYTNEAGLCRVNFDSSEAQQGFEVWVGQALANTYTWCDHCEKIVKITNLKANATPVAEAEGHYRFMEDVSYTFPENGDNAFFTITGRTYIDLNGCDVTVDGGRFIVMNGASEATVVDTKGGAIVTGSNNYYSGGGLTLHVNKEGAVLNLKGGTFRGMDDTSEAVSGNNGECKDTPVVRMRAGGTINLFEGATIDGSTLTGRTVATVFIGYKGTESTFNIKGGTVIGAANTSTIDAIRVGSDNTGDAVLNLESGSVVGAGGLAVQVRTGATANISGGSITLADGKGGALGSYGGDLTMNISGGNLPTVNAVSGTTLTLSGAPVIGILYTNGNLANVDALSTDANITVSAAVGTILTAATENVIGGAIKHSNIELSIKQNADGQYYVAADYDEPVEGVFAPENCGGYAYCPICGTKEKWTPITEPTKMEGGHYYLADHIEDATYSGDYSGYITGSGCLNLNGKNVTLTGGGRFLFIDGTNVATVMDTAGTSVIKGSCDNGAVTSYYGATVRVNAADSVLNLYGGTYERIDDTETAKDFGVPVVGVRGGTLNIFDGATIQNGDIAKFEDARGGNLYINSANKATVNMYGGAILNGCADSGGNIFANAGATLNIEGGFIGGGTASSGANIHLNTYTGSTAVNFTVKGNATIVGGIRAGVSTVMTVAGTPKILPSAEYQGVSYTAATGTTNINFAATMDQLTKGAEIWYESALTATYVWCDHCEAMVKWTNLYAEAAPVAEAEGHYRFLEDVSYTFAENGNKNYFTTKGTTYIDLNGCDVTVDGGRFIEVSVGAQVTVIDSVGGAIVTGSNDYYSGGGVTIHVNHKDAVLNLKGGTYRGMNDTSTAVSGKNGECKDTPVVRMRAGGTINLYTGATIDGTTLTDRSNATVYLGYSNTLSTFNMEGGTVLGGKNSEGDGGAFRVGDGTGTAVLNVNSGFIKAGSASVGNAIQVRAGNTLNVNGGLIVTHEDNISSSGLIYVQNTGVMNVNGGVIVGYIYQVNGADVNLTGTPKIVTEYTDENGVTYEGSYGLRPRDGALFNVDGLTAGAEIVVTVGGYGVPLTEAYTGDLDMNTVLKGNTAVFFEKNTDNQYCAVRPAAGIGNVPYATVEEALEAYDISSGESIFFSGEAVINEDIIINAYTCEGAVISGNGTVYGYDSDNWDFNGFSFVTITGNVKVAAEYDHETGDEIRHYIALKEGEDQYSFHRVEIRLTHVSLRPSQAGIYYWTEYKCDTYVRDRVQVYGVALSVNDMPGADFATDADTKYTVMRGTFANEYGKSANYTVNATSGSVFGILKEGRDAAVNGQYLDMAIYANSYLTIDVDGNGTTKTVMSDVKNGGKKTTDEGFDGVAYTLADVVKAINDQFADLGDENKDSMIAFAAKWNEYLDDAGKAKWAAATSNMKAA